MRDQFDKLGYLNTLFHRIIPGKIIQGGDVYLDGSGGQAAHWHDVNHWDKPMNLKGFPDEDKTWKNKHDKRGLLTMVNEGPDTNKS